MPLSIMTIEQRLNVVEQESEAPQEAFTSACPTTFPSATLQGSTSYLAAAYARAIGSIEYIRLSNTHCSVRGPSAALSVRKSVAVIQCQGKDAKEGPI